MARRGKRGPVVPPLSPDEEIIRDEITRQLIERREVKAAVLHPREFARDSRARRVAYATIPAHPTVKLALMMAERLRFLAMRVDGVLAFDGDPVAPVTRAVELAIAPQLRELAELTAPFEGTSERQRDKLIDLVEWAAWKFQSTAHGENDWREVISALRFELSGALPAVVQHVSDEDLGRSMSVFLPPRLRPDWENSLPKWDQLKTLAERAQLGVVDADTVRVQYTRHRSARRKQEQAERDELARQPVGTGKLDRLTGDARRQAEERLRSIEARALVVLRGRRPAKPEK